MASTGTQTTWSSNGGYYLKIRWDITSQNIETNRSGVRVRMYFGAKSGWSLSDSSNSWSLTVDGSTSSGSANISVSGNEDLIEDRQFFIDHNSDGTKSISINGAISGLYFGGINPSAFTANLDAIPRASTISSTATLNADYNSNIGITRYSSNFTHTLDIYLTKSGVADKYVKQLSYTSAVTSRSTAWDSDDRKKMFESGHGYWTGTRMVLKTYSGGSLVGTTEKTGSFDYPSINSVGSVSSFTLGNNASASISKASDLYAHQIELRIGSTVIGSESYTTGTTFSIPINPTTVLNALPTSKTGTVDMYIRTTLASDNTVLIRTWTLEDSATVTIPDTYSPNFTDSQFTYADMNGTITGITGDNQIIVSGLSTLQVNVNSVAVPSTGASIISYQATAGDRTGSRTSTGAILLGAVTTSSNTVTLTVTATDSRGMQTSATKTITVIPYQAPTVTGNVTRNNGFDEATTIRTSGVVSRLVVNGVAKNNLTSIQYRTKQTTSGSWSSWDNITFTAPTGTNTSYTANNKSITVPSLESWNVEVKATDTMGSTTTRIYTVSAGTPLVFMDTDRNSVGIGTFPTGSDELRVKGYIHGGALSTNGHTLDASGLSGGGTSFIKKSANLLVLNDGGFNTSGIKLVGNTEITGSATIGSGSITAVLNHSSGYMGINSFSTATYGDGKGEVWYRADQRRFTFSSRNASDTSAQTATILVDQVNTKVVQASTTGSHNYLQTGSSWEWQVTANGTTDSYRPIRASSFPTGSSINYKTNLENIDVRVDALELIKETDVWHYHLKSNLEGGIYDKPKVGVISEMVNPLIRDEDGVDPYSMIALSWRAIQQQDEIIKAQADEIENLKAQNEAIFSMLQDLQNQIDSKG